MYSLLNSQSIRSNDQSNVDEYSNSKSMLGLTYISIGHRPTITQYHQKQLHIIDGTRFEITPINSIVIGD
jgi:vitamin B12/bleomycin/antimicrobial peptide transport system ATP-binding/permease protein